jgi:hypothetical protein
MAPLRAYPPAAVHRFVWTKAVILVPNWRL